LDTIRITGIRAYGRHGADPGERERRQLIVVDVVAELDLQAAAAGDELAQTADYAAMRERLIAIVATTSYALLERLAADLLEAIFEDARIRRAAVTLSKPGILQGATPSVTLRRENPVARA
jgi:7,8-dihydroneopterin aldolase/epimerase/oxygenase